MTRGRHEKPKESFTYLQSICLLSIFTGMVVGVYEQFVNFTASEYTYLGRALMAMFITFVFLISISVIMISVIDDWASPKESNENVFEESTEKQRCITCGVENVRMPELHLQGCKTTSSRQN
jgi:putative copper export protein